MPHQTQLNLYTDILSHSNTVTHTSRRQVRFIKMLANILVIKKRLSVMICEFNQKDRN